MELQNKNRCAVGSKTSILIAIILLVSSISYSQPKFKFGYVFTAGILREKDRTGYNNHLYLHPLGFYGDLNLNKKLKLTAYLAHMIFIGGFLSTSVKYQVRKHLYLGSGIKLYHEPLFEPVIISLSAGISLSLKKDKYFIEMFSDFPVYQKLAFSKTLFILGLNIGARIYP